MKSQFFSVLAFLFAIVFSNSGIAGNGPGDPVATLDETESAQLIWMREEEKLAHDAYITFYNLWGMNLFSNTSSSEQNHMDAMLKMLEKFGIPDPVTSDAVGSFNDPSLAAMYVSILEDGNDSQLDALLAGAYVEEMDISDLQEAIAYTDEPALLNSYGNLLAASRNHLRNFVSHIANLGVEYEAQVLDPADVDDIVGDYDLVPGANFTINAGLNDTWYYPATDGQGFLITVYPDRGTVFLAWFTFDIDLPAEGAVATLGDAGQRWLTAQGSYSGGQADLGIHFASGGTFDSGEWAPQLNPAGSIMLQFDDCTSGSVTYDIPSIDRAGVVPIVRVAPDNIGLCQELNAASQ